LMDLGLSERGHEILQAVITSYIERGLPVGSRILSRKYPLDLSAASIRNVMADLEEMGFLAQPHKSAGRIPTDKGFRYYVDSILKVQELSREERFAIEEGYQDTHTEPTEILKNTSEILSQVTHYTGLVLSPRFSNAVLEQIEFIKLRERRILIILVSTSGVVQNKIVQLDRELGQEELDRFNTYVNTFLGNLTLAQLKERIIQELQREKVVFDELFYRSLELSREALDASYDGDLFIGGRTNIFQQPEFEDIQQMRKLMRAFEEKHILIRLLDKSASAQGIQIFIGAENEIPEIQDCTVITTRFGQAGRLVGTLGVIGPKRMNYSKIIPLVEYTADLLTQALESS
jgi:heat-inducible transcriptional repressor